MEIEWSKVPEWIYWVSPESKKGSKRCYGWASKPIINKESDEFENWWCTDDDGYFCELPWYIAIVPNKIYEPFQWLI